MRSPPGGPPPPLHLSGGSKSAITDGMLATPAPMARMRSTGHGHASVGDSSGRLGLASPQLSNLHRIESPGRASTRRSGMLSDAGSSGRLVTPLSGSFGQLGAQPSPQPPSRQRFFLHRAPAPPAREPSHVSYLRKLATGVRASIATASLYVEIRGSHRAKAIAADAARLLMAGSGGGGASDASGSTVVDEVATTAELEALAHWRQADASMATEAALRKRLGLRTHPLVLERLHPFWLCALRSQAAHRATEEREEREEREEAKGARSRRGVVSPPTASGTSARGDEALATATATTATTTITSAAGAPLMVRQQYSAHDILDGGQVATATLERDGYFLMYSRIFRVLLEEFDDEAAEEEIGADWDNDTAGEDEAHAARGDGAWRGGTEGGGRGQARPRSLTRERFGDALFELADTWTHGVSASEYAGFLDHLFAAIAVPDPTDQTHHVWRPAHTLTFEAQSFGTLLGHNDDETDPHPTSHRSYLPSPHRPLAISPQKQPPQASPLVLQLQRQHSLDSPRRQRQERCKGQRRAAVLIQSCARGHLGRRRMRRMRAMVVRIQSSARSRAARRRARRLRGRRQSHSQTVCARAATSLQRGSIPRISTVAAAATEGLTARNRPKTAAVPMDVVNGTEGTDRAPSAGSLPWKDPSMVQVPPMRPAAVARPYSALPGLAFNMQAANARQWELLLTGAIPPPRPKRPQSGQPPRQPPPPHRRRPKSARTSSATGTSNFYGVPHCPTASLTARILVLHDPLHARVPLYKTFLAPPPLRFEGSPRKPGVGAPNAAWGAGLGAQRRTSAAPKVEVRRGALTQSMILRPLLA